MLRVMDSDPNNCGGPAMARTQPNDRFESHSLLVASAVPGTSVVAAIRASGSNVADRDERGRQSFTGAQEMIDRVPDHLVTSEDDGDCAQARPSVMIGRILRPRPNR